MNLPEPKLTEIAQKVLAQRYLIKNEAGEVIETPRELFTRVAKAIAQDDEYESRYYEMMTRGDFLPNTPCLINAGRPHGQGQFSACFVLSVEDDMESIFETMKNMAMIHKSGGGTGFSFSRLRPKNDFVRSTTGVASGPVSFMRAYDHVTECVKQSGIRRGANMGILRVDHPDIRDFISCKDDVTQITNFNISVGITNAFMEALIDGAKYALINPRNNVIVEYVSPREIWDMIAQRAHATGDPGLFFIDRVNEQDPLAHVPRYEIEAVNPCGEVPLCAYNACTLGSINLGNFIEDGRLNSERLEATVELGVRFLDDVLEHNQYPVKEIAEVTAATRKIGLGVMGWADALVKMGIPYNTHLARKQARMIMQRINDTAAIASKQLARERDAFPEWENSKWHNEKDSPRRNVTVTAIAPTGSISIIAGCSSGIEPLFALCQTRNQADMIMVDFNPLFEEVASREGFWTESVRKHVIKHGSVAACDEVPERWREVFAIAGEIEPLAHVKMQAAFQEHVEDAVSKTINLPASALVKDVEDAYMAAWNLGCKGITVYRDGSRPNQTLTVGAAPEKKLPNYYDYVQQDTDAEAEEEWVTIDNSQPDGFLKKERRRVPVDGRRRGVTFTTKTAYGSVHMVINEHPDDGQPFELFITMGKGGSEVSAWSEALGRSISLMLATSQEPRARLVELVEQLSGIGGGGSHGFGENRVASAADGVARCIRSYLGAAESATGALDLCPECRHAALVKSGGCDVCTRCGYSKC